MKPIPFAFIAVLVAVTGCAPAYRYESARGVMDKHVAADSVKSVVLKVHTTGDGKDSDLLWSIEIHGNNIVYGTTEVGTGDVWKKDTDAEIVVNLDTPFAYSQRASIQVTVMQKTLSEDPRWSGALSASGVMGDNTVKSLLERSREFKLGGAGNSKSMTLSFQ